TNGTRALARAKHAAAVAVGSFVNADRAARFLSEGIAEGEPATVLCAGWTGRVSLEDTLAAGLLVSRVIPASEAPALSDPAKMAYAIYQGSRDDLLRAVHGTDHARRLHALGYGSDIDLCCTIDTLDVLPVLRDGRITAG
ncbi:MAG: 2-phosphosulfolactate phosphatase, partial [Bacteroidota bacterium]